VSDATDAGDAEDFADDEDLDDDDLDEDLEDDGPDEFNRVIGAVPRAVLEYVAKAIVDEPEGVEVDASERRGGVMLSLHVAPDDMGKVIGRRGRVAQAIRTVVRAAGAKEGIEASVDIVD
jgi:predicted RNA-binding protein YlqC (UPF0109 family)